MWKCTTSKSWARRATRSVIARCSATESTVWARRSDRGQHGIRRADVQESPLANSVTSWPQATSCSVRYDTIRSVPPYSRGGTLSCNGAT